MRPRVLSLAIAAIFPSAFPCLIHAQCNWNSGDGTGTCTTLGSVGIGTTTPQTLLDVGGEALFPSITSAFFKAGGGALGTASGSEIVLANFAFASSNATSLSVRAQRVSTGSSWTTAAMGITGDVDDTPYAAGQIWLYNGNVGIGTTAPQQLLDVAGTMAAREIIVSSTGADYVFGPDYRLPSLTEVAAYIADHHHLPDIPSAAEMKEKGVGVADMQAKLLAEIEELTLHMIQADERNNRLEKENRKLMEAIQRIQERIGQ
jgi:hypothetical protein